MSAELILDNIARRRSVRVFKEEQIEESALQAILAAGRVAPSGGNNQTTHIMVIQRESVLRQLRDLAEAEFAKMEPDENTYSSLRNSIRLSKQGGYEFYYKAPTLIVTANRKGYGNALVDSACVLENMMLAATALEIGSCWINQLHWLDEHASIRTVLEELGLGENETITGGLALGYPANGNAFHALERQGNPVTYIR